MTSSPDTDPGFVARHLTQRVLDLGPFDDIPAARHLAALGALGSLFRCRALLDSMVTLRDAGRSDTIGVLARCLFEYAIYGSLVLYGTDADLERLDEDWRHYANDLSRKLPVDDAELHDGTTKRFPLSQRAKRLGELLEQVRHENPDAPTKWYEWFYSGESFYSAHPNGASVSRYIATSGAGTLGYTPDPSEQPVDRGSLIAAINLTYILAGYLCDEFNVDRTDLDATPGLLMLLEGLN